MPRITRRMINSETRRRNERVGRRSQANVIIPASIPAAINDSVKCAINANPINVVVYNLGELSLSCIHCEAVHFEKEITSNNTQTFTLCCHKGKVSLPSLQQSSVLQYFCDGLTSHQPNIKHRSKNFFENIRSYNSAFSMASSEANIDRSLLQGIYHFKIHDVIYHRIGGLVPQYGTTPRYAQLYFYDVETANNYRLRLDENNNCDGSIMSELAHHLNAVNPYIHTFRTMAEISHANPTANVRMYITVDQRSDTRRYNDAMATDVATVFTSDDGTPPTDRHMVVFAKDNSPLQYISYLNSALDPLCYPLLFPYGDEGWHQNIDQMNTNRKVSMLQFACFRLAIRLDTFSFLHRSQKLFLQWIVDMYVRIEGARLQYLRLNQGSLRAELYSNLTDFLNQRNVNNNINDIERIGRRVILPSTFIGSPRNMHQNYLDAMAMVQKFGKPSLFITMTCNPKWPEIVNNLAPGEAAHFRPDLIVRVFHCKLKQLMESIIKKKNFGTVQALIYTIEFQKRGLPHAHILLTLQANDLIFDIDTIDKVVSAEIPDQNENPILHELVRHHMMHGPCGALNPSSVCMQGGVCKKKFPKDFIDRTYDNVLGYPVYKRRDNGATVSVRGSDLDNRYVVPYNPYLLSKFNCHINVEVCTTVKSVKYIYKYVYKGYDCATVRFVTSNADPLAAGPITVYDEIDSFLNGRYVGSTESAWRIFEYEMHYQIHTIVRLDCHLPNDHTIIFRDGNAEQAVERNRTTKLLAFFKLNITDPTANQYLYTDIPYYYVWKDATKEWVKRRNKTDTIISRLYAISVRDVEKFHLRLLLLHVHGPKSFEDLRTYNGILYPTFVEAAYARRIASNDNEWRDCLLEAKETDSAFKLRHLFALICALNNPPNALFLWNEFREFLADDYLQIDEDTAYNRALIDINEILLTHNLSCSHFGLPIPQYNTGDDHLISQQIDILAEGAQFDQMYLTATDEQKNIIDKVIQEVLLHNTGSNVFCLTAYAGCGKTFVQNAIIHKLQSLNLICIPCAFSGIASTLLPKGKTLHNVFKIPIPVTETSVSSISANSIHATRINAASFIMIDEVSMCPLLILKLIDSLLRDIATPDNRDKLFGGKTILLSGDFRQTLPVIPHAHRSTLIENCIISWSSYWTFHKCTLTQNMRALQQEIEFVEFLKHIGDGTMPFFPQFGEDIIEIPPQLIGTGDIIEDTYGVLDNAIQLDGILGRVILAPRNEDCSIINTDILNKLSGIQQTYFSYDSVVTDDEFERNQFPIEFLNSLSLTGLPPHKLSLKEGAIVLLIRNLNTGMALVNGTRMRIKRMHRNTIDCEVLTGFSAGKRILIPRIHMTYTGTLMPFTIRRVQFPIILAFAMTINKSQGQTFDRVSILLPRPVFAHGQLYVAASRVRTFDGLRFYITDQLDQGHLMGRNNERVFTKNIVYREIL